jgi:hypothetical protein
MGDSLPAASAFAHVMSEFLQNLVVCFPEHQGPASALSMLQLVGETAHEAMASAWWKFSRPIAAAIRERDAALTMRAFDESEFQIMRQLGAGTILADSVDAETRASVWQYMDSLTSLSELAVAGKPVAPATPAAPVAPAAPAAPAAPSVFPVTSAMAPPAVAPKPAPPAAAPPVAAPKPADLLKGITSAIPEIFKSLNDVLKSDENGPLSSLIKQMVNPNQLQSGFSGNLMSNMQAEPDTAVMEQVSADTGLTAAMITEKLRRLELYEKRRNTKKKK